MGAHRDTPTFNRFLADFGHDRFTDVVARAQALRDETPKAGEKAIRKQTAEELELTVAEVNKVMGHVEKLRADG